MLNLKLIGAIALIGVLGWFFRKSVINLAKKLYGDFSREELKKFLLLAVIFGFTIGVYWLLRPLKDGVFCNIVGASNIPYAKWLSLVIIFPLVMVYSKLVDKFPRHKVFYALCAIYGLLAFAFAYLLHNPVLGLANVQPFTLPNGKIETHHVLAIGRLIGWAWYVFIESFGSLMVALFWSFAADTTTPESAKKGYGIIAMGAQAGGIVGPLAVATYAKQYGPVPMAFAAGLGIFGIALMIKYFMSVIPKDQLVGYEAKHETATQKKHEKEETGFMEGLKLMLSQPYLLAIFAVISLYEIVVTVFDYQLKSMASESLSGAGALSAYLGEYGVWTNGLSLICLLLGINTIGRKLGLTVSLVLLPILIAGFVAAIWMSPTLQVAFWVMVLSKAINYALNQPSKEQLYIPTTKDTKYKAKAWTEMFGSRSSKAAGSGINVLNRFMDPSMFIAMSSLISFGLIGLWIMCALYLGRTHKKAVTENKVVC